MRNIITYTVLVLLVAALYNCRPERVYIDDPDARLTFTDDTVFFDTVFTTIGSVTKSFRVHNKNERFIKIKDIKLAGGESSVFRINVDGTPGTEFSDYEIAPHDSMWVFVEATLDPNGSPDILRIQDSITFSVNGNLQDVDLVAWGQDVHILRDSVLDYSTNWIADKPYLIIGGIWVDAQQTLTMESGVQVHMHRDASIIIEGTLKMEGTLEDPVTVQGDRLEKLYEDKPGQWGAIWLLPGSSGNVIDHARIINGTAGFVADSVTSDTEPGIYITNTEINQMSYDGIMSVRSSIEAKNLVIGDCGNSCLEILYEGRHKYTHCTFANYWYNGYSNRRTPALLISNFYAYEDSNAIVVVPHDLEQAVFKNCIIYGGHNHELVVSKAEGGILNYTFDHCLTRMDLAEYDYTLDPNFISITNNKDPMFDSLHVSYELDSLSAAIDKGLLNYVWEENVPYDKNGNDRTADGLPDLGAFERFED